jgi:hypothetical protein
VVIEKRWKITLTIIISALLMIFLASCNDSQTKGSEAGSTASNTDSPMRKVAAEAIEEAENEGVTTPDAIGSGVPQTTTSKPIITADDEFWVSELYPDHKDEYTMENHIKGATNDAIVKLLRRTDRWPTLRTYLESRANDLSTYDRYLTEELYDHGGYAGEAKYETAYKKTNGKYFSYNIVMLGNSPCNIDLNLTELGEKRFHIKKELATSSPSYRAYAYFPDIESIVARDEGDGRLNIQIRWAMTETNLSCIACFNAAFNERPSDIGRTVVQNDYFVSQDGVYSFDGGSSKIHFVDEEGLR